MKISGISPKEARAVVRRAMKAGCRVELSGGTHLRIITPSGVVVRGALTGSHNSAIYLYRDLKRAGVFD